MNNIHSQATYVLIWLVNKASLPGSHDFSVLFHDFSKMLLSTTVEQQRVTSKNYDISFELVDSMLRMLNLPYFFGISVVKELVMAGTRATAVLGYYAIHWELLDAIIYRYHGLILVGLGSISSSLKVIRDFSTSCIVELEKRGI